MNQLVGPYLLLVPYGIHISQETGRMVWYSHLFKSFPVRYNPHSQGSEYIRQNAGLDEAQAGIKIARRNINNLRYADVTTHLAESEEKKSLFKKFLFYF